MSETNSPAADVDVASILAKSGIETQAEYPTVVPDVTTGEATVAPESATKTPEAETTSTGQEKATPAQVPQQASPEKGEELSPGFDWRQELTKTDAADILKELGFDDKMIGFFNKWRTDGNIAEYLKAISVDYSKMSPEQLMKHQLQEEYPEFSSEDLEELYQSMVVEKYKLNPELFSESEVRRGKILIAADAKKIRDTLQTKQQDYILSAKPPVREPDTKAQQIMAEQQAIMEKYTQTINSHATTKELLANRKLTIGEGDNAFNYEIQDPGRLLTILQNPEEYAKHVFQQDGTPIVDKQLFIAAAALDHNSLATELIKYGRSLGAKQAIEQIENAKKPDPALTKGAEEFTNPAQALARAGLITSS